MILEEIAAAARARVERLKRDGYYRAIEEQAYCRPAPHPFRFQKQLEKKGLSVIAELKKASPSKGVISRDFPFLDIARDYEAAGAAAISCLTEPRWFQGSIRYLAEVSQAVTIPVLRKDFIVDRCQIEEAALAGASAVLLIAAILTNRELGAYMECARKLGLSVLAEAHDGEEVRRLVQAGAGIIGVNNRNLKDFTIDLETAERLRPLIPRGTLCVAESGMTDPASVRRMREAGADAVLIGEMLMTAGDRKALLREIKRENG